MISKECGVCNNKSVPQNESIKVDEIVYCGNCFAKSYPNKDTLRNKIVDKELDPTVCARCTTDFGKTELTKISRYPVCDGCNRIMSERTFPLWVKGFFGATVALVIFAFAWNWKFYQAYDAIKQANAAFTQSDYAKASQLMSFASEKVPSVDDVTILAKYFRGIYSLSQDDGAKALAEFVEIRDRVPKDYNVDRLILEAQISSSYNNKNYDGFLSAAKGLLAMDSTTAMTWTSVASAYACIYAEQGTEKARHQSLKHLAYAKVIDDSTKEMIQYYNMVEYRLFSRRIIKREEFLKEFPNGWTNK
jgi:hypothetical protein